MARVASSIPSLFNGVSQQADTLRLLTQGEEQVNMYPSLVQGLVKRPPLQRVSSAPMDDADVVRAPGTFHVIDRGGDNAGRTRALLYVSARGLAVYGPEGARKPVTATPAALAYLASGLDGKFDIVTVADHTFVSNPRVKTKMASGSGGGGGGGVNAGVVQVVRAAYDTTYTIEVEVAGDVYPQGTKILMGSHQTPSATGTTENPPEKISTVDIALALARGVVRNAEFIAENTSTPVALHAYSSGSSIAITPNGGFRIVKISVKDGQGNTLMKAVFDTVARFSDLPSEAVPGMIVKVTGSDTTQYNDYYVIFVPTSPR